MEDITKGEDEGLTSEEIFTVVDHDKLVGEAYFLLQDESELDVKYEARVVMSINVDDDASARNPYRFSAQDMQGIEMGIISGDSRKGEIL